VIGRRESAAQDEIMLRAVRGAAVMGVRGAAIPLVALGGTLALVGLLSTTQFGAVALGLSITNLGLFTADGGLAAGLVRRARAPTQDELRHGVGLQLLLTVAVVALVWAIALPLGGAGLAVAIMISGLPLTAFRTPGLVVSERELNFRPPAVVEVSEMVAFYAWAVGAALLGFGVLGVATAAPVRAVVGTLVMVRLAPTGVVRPRFGATGLRELIRFGVRFQSVNLVNVARYQGINIAIAAVGGLGTLGVWTLAFRFMQVPLVLFGALWRVSFPTMGRLLASGAQVRPIAERTARAVAVPAGLVLSVLGVVTPAAVPSIVGADWAEVGTILAPILAGMLIGGPISVASAGYLFASDRPEAVLKCGIAHTVVWFAVSLSLLPLIGPVAIGVGGLLGWLAESAFLSAAMARALGVRFAAPLLRPTVVALLAALPGAAIVVAGPATLAVGATAGAVTGGVHLLLSWSFDRPTLRELFTLGKTARRRVRAQAA
jgi:O-antigen/teichoic acid export membrane protein